MDRVDALVIGAGVIGLAVGRALARTGLETIVVERSAAIGTETSARNSEVIHAGLYDAPGSLKSRLCVQGRRRLYDFCASHGVAFRRCGKLVVAADAAQAAQLDRIQAQARANGVDDLVRLDRAAARALEPALDCAAALCSPSTGIVDSHGLMLALQGDFESAGGMVALHSPVLALTCGTEGHVLQIGGGAPTELLAQRVVNAAGLWAPGLARRFDGLAPACVPRARFAKGNYFSLAARVPFTRLIYPVPQAGGLGVHLTLDLGGQARFGPDVQWLDIDSPETIDYRVDAARGAAFDAAIRRWWPGLPDGALMPDYSGVRPKLHGPGEPAADFVVQGPREHGVAGLVNLFGIESPGLTASLAIADEVLALLSA